MIKYHYLICDCGTPEHDVRFSYDTEFGELEVDYFLHHHKSFWKRIWPSIKYLFGYGTAEYCGMLARQDELDSLARFLNCANPSTYIAPEPVEPLRWSDDDERSSAENEPCAFSAEDAAWLDSILGLSPH